MVARAYQGLSESKQLHRSRGGNQTQSGPNSHLGKLTFSFRERGEIGILWLGVLRCFRFNTKDLQRTTWATPQIRLLESAGIGLSLGKGSMVYGSVSSVSMCFEMITCLLPKRLRRISMACW